MPTAAHHHSTPGVDARFLRRVHLSSLFMTLLFAAVSATTLSPAWGLAFLVAGLWSTANFWVLERLLRAAMQPQGRDLITIAVAAVVKLPVLYALLLWMLMRGGFEAVPMAAGLSMPLVVIVLKAIGRSLVTRWPSTGLSTGTSARSTTSPSQPRS